MNRLEQTTADYWEVSKFLRDPDAPGNISHSEAFRILDSADYLRPEEWRLRELMHVITYDIIEGNTKWREQQRAVGSVLILHTKG